MPPRHLTNSSFGLIALGASLLLAGCAAPPEGFDDPTPAGRLQAIREAGRAQDKSPETLRELVRSLSSDDPVERMLAIRTLEKLTGETHGYRHFEPLADRQAAVNRWLDWLHAEGLAEGPIVLWDVLPQPESDPPKEEPSPS
ncbi:MAG: hypothetical protein ACF8NJ_03675 [Phycisphaerales bacterium JB038]